METSGELGESRTTTVASPEPDPEPDWAALNVARISAAPETVYSAVVRDSGLVIDPGPETSTHLSNS